MAIENNCSGTNRHLPTCNGECGERNEISTQSRPIAGAASPSPKKAKCTCGAGPDPLYKHERDCGLFAAGGESTRTMCSADIGKVPVVTLSEEWRGPEPFTPKPVVGRQSPLDLISATREGIQVEELEHGVCPHCGADRSGPSAEAHSEDCPDAGGSSTGEQPTSGVCPCCGTKLIRQTLTLPHYVDWCSGCGTWANPFAARPVSGTEPLPDSRMRCSECQEPVCDHLAAKLLPWLKVGDTAQHEHEIKNKGYCGDWELLNELFQLVNRLWEAEPLDTPQNDYLHGLKLKIIKARDAAAPSLTPRCPKCLNSALDRNGEAVECRACEESFPTPCVSDFRQFFSEAGQ